jgi:cullin 1
MREESGSNFVKKIENMIKDLLSSIEINSNYLNDINNNNKSTYIKILSQENWPLDQIQKPKIENLPNIQDYLLISINLPNQLKSILQNFNNFYYNKFKYRYLIYLPELSWAEINFKPNNNNNYTLIVNTYQLCILMLFNKNKKLNLNTISNETKINISELESFYHELVKNNILIFNNNEKTLEVNYKFNNSDDNINNKEKINLNFKYVNKKNKNNIENNNNNEKEIDHFMLEDRKYQIDAYIIHELKKNKIMTFESIKENLFKNLKNYFNPELKIIKERLENLINRNLIERDKNDNNIFSYLA